MTTPDSDEHFMRECLREAAAAEAAGEVPVGAVVVRDGQIIGRGHNRPIGAHDPTAHAEIVALRAAGLAAGNYRLVDAELFVSVEPCVILPASARSSRPVCAGWSSAAAIPRRARWAGKRQPRRARRIQSPLCGPRRRLRGGRARPAATLLPGPARLALRMLEPPDDRPL